MTTTCCPNCSSAVAAGNEIVSVCTECAGVSVAGASLTLPTVLIGTAVIAATALTVGAIHRVLTRLPQPQPQPITA
ncbi:MAG: hypothetical protein AAGI30_07650 [Planctomycetota bacterium]